MDPARAGETDWMGKDMVQAWKIKVTGAQEERTKNIVLLELTVLWEDCLDKAHEKKRSINIV